MPTSDKIFTLPSLKSQIAEWKQEGEKVVFTNGCFDILHLGHVDYLERASEMGTKMIIGLNSDSSVRELKGENRPVNPEYARARLLASMQFVEAVIIFSDETPAQLISDLLPDVLVKGNDYKVSEIAGADSVLANGGEVKTVSLVDGYSTTKTIQKILE